MNDLIWGCLAGYIIGFFITFGVKTYKFKTNRGWDNDHATCTVFAMAWVWPVWVPFWIAYVIAKECAAK